MAGRITEIAIVPADGTRNVYLFLARDFLFYRGYDDRIVEEGRRARTRTPNGEVGF